MRRLMLVGMAVLTFGLGREVARSAPPESAARILNAAKLQSAETHRNVFVIFHASWCIWCRRLDSVITQAEVSPLIDKYFVVVHLDVLERGEKKAIENPGADLFLRKLGGEKSGLPFYAFLDAKGEKIADSNVMQANTQNIGFPGSEEERAAFRNLLSLSAPTMPAGDLAKIMSHFDKR